jgi:hypothetical protein
MSSLVSCLARPAGLRGYSKPRRVPAPTSFGLVICFHAPRSWLIAVKLDLNMRRFVQNCDDVLINCDDVLNKRGDQVAPTAASTGRPELTDETSECASQNSWNSWRDRFCPALSAVSRRVQQ